MRTLALLLLANLIFTFSIGPQAADFQQIRIKGPKNSDTDFSGQTYGPITSSDTLWRIASQARQNSSHSIYQVMLATYELNPGAFERNNINLLRDGAILRMPASQYVGRVNEAQAIAKVRYDNQLLNIGGEAGGNNAVNKTEKALVSKDDLDETKDIIEKRLGAIDEEQNRQFQQIRQQFAESILNVQSILNENQRVFESLDSVNKDLAEIRSQEAVRDEQMDKMGKSIDELLAKSREAEAKALAQLQKGGFGDWLMKPLTLIITSILFSLLLLGGFGFWLVKRKKSEEMDLDLLATKDEPADTYVASEMDDLSDALSEELSSELDDENLFGEQSIGDDVLAEELKESFDDKEDLEDKEEFDDLGDDMLVPDSELNPTEDFEAGSDELDQDDLDNLFEDEDDLLDEIDDEMDNISLSDDEEEDQSEADNSDQVIADDLTADQPDATPAQKTDDADLVDSASEDVESEAIIDDGGDEDDESQALTDLDNSSETESEVTSASVSDIAPIDDADEQPEISIDDLLVEPKPELPESSEVNADDPINEDMLEQLDKEIASQSEELDNITSNLIDELEQVEMMQDMLPEGKEEVESEYTGTPQHDIQQLDKITEDLGDIFADAEPALTGIEENSLGEQEQELSTEENNHTDDTGQVQSSPENTSDEVNASDTDQKSNQIEPELDTSSKDGVAADSVNPAESELNDTASFNEHESENDTLNEDTEQASDDVIDSEETEQTDELPSDVLSEDSEQAPDDVIASEETEQTGELPSDVLSEDTEQAPDDVIASEETEQTDELPSDVLSEDTEQAPDDVLIEDTEQGPDDAFDSEDAEQTNAALNEDIELSSDKVSDSEDPAQGSDTQSEISETTEEADGVEPQAAPDPIDEDDALEQALADFDSPSPKDSATLSPADDIPSPEVVSDNDVLGDFNDDELESALENFVLDDDVDKLDDLSNDQASSAAQPDNELDEFPELEDWLNEVDEEDKETIEDLESSSFDDMLQSLDDDLNDTLESTSAEEQTPSNTNQAGQEIDSAVDIATLLEEGEPEEAERDFVDVDDLLNDSITADPLPEKALDLESIMGEFSTAQEDSDHVDVDSDDGFGAKLDLAHAYIEIGETESATELLEDIVENGHPPQSDEAKRVLDSLLGEK